MSEIEYLSPEIANEGLSAANWTPGVWANDAPAGEEWQPDIEPPRLNDYAAFRKHKHYGKYFRPYRYVPFPAWMYHKTEEPKLCQSKEDVIALGPEWAREPFHRKIDMTGKALPVKTDTQRLAESITAGLAAKNTGAGPIDATTIAAIVAAVMAATQKPAEAAPVAVAPIETKVEAADIQEVTATVSIERQAMIELAEKENVKIDKRWSDDKIKAALGL